MILLFEILSFALTGALIFHSVKVRGTAFTILFFVTGAVLGILRENVVAQVTDLYSYNPSAFTFWIGAAPLVLAVFWSFTTYISMTLSERLVHGDFVEGKRLVPILLVSMVFMGAYAAMNEAMASVFPMVIWKLQPAATIWGGAPIMVVFGYGGLALIFLTGVYIIQKRRWRVWVKVVVGVLSTLLMIPLHLAWIAGVRAVIAKAVTLL
ncbi:MAG: hypothetical protein JW984_07975 [Deltaproteobacteria bacterium]|uniref:Uncharacterized protein n=1 Tax=Candidatus Zymogenus saltonus TaxID=2844893 RepID=A0A9D8KFD1_9DELT|nr:hypothetical protein [Candidatus Zymogenus saltonus]